MSIKKWPQEKIDKLVAVLSVILAIAMMGGVLALSYFAMKNLSAQYAAAMSADLSQGWKGVLSYSDHLYADLGFATEIVAESTNKSRLLNSFVDSSLTAIISRILAAGVLYVMVITTVTVFARYHGSEGDGSSIVQNTVLTVFWCYVVYGVAIVAMLFLMKIPIKLPSLNHLALLGIGLLGVISGSLAVALVMKFVPYRKIVAAAAIPVMAILFLVGFKPEASIYSSPTVDSFEYVYQQQPQILQEDYTGDAYYDERKNVMVVEGVEYAPQQVANPDYASGIGRIAAIGFEAINPYSGSSLAMVQDTITGQVPLKVAALYGARVVILAVLVIFLHGKDE